MFSFLLWLFLGLAPAHAQNTTCATRPTGDSTNACASTAFVHGGFQPTLPNFTANNPLIGNGTNVPAQGTRQGSSTVFPTVDGTSTNGQCAVFDSFGGFTSQACSGSGSGTVGSGLAGQYAYYPSNGTGVVGISPAQLGLCDTLEAHGGGISQSASTNTTAYNAATAAFGTNGGCIAFGAGIYSLNAVSFSYPATTPYAVTLIGLGAETTILNFPSGNGIGLTIQSQNHTFHIENMSITTTGINAGTGISVNFASPTTGPNSFSTIDNVTMRGSNNSTEYWSTDINDVGVSFINFNNDFIIGASGLGLNIAGSTSASFPYAIVFNLHNINFGGLSTAFKYGDHVQGVAITNSNFTNGTSGIFTPSGISGLDELTVTNSQFNETTFNILFESAVPFQFTGDTFIVAASTGAVTCTACSVGQFTGNQFVATSPTGSVGIDVASSAAPGIGIVNNSFSGFSTAVVCASGVYCNLQSNMYANNTNKSSPATTTGNVFIGGGGQ